MMLLAYVLLGHRDWQEAEISIFAAFPRQELQAERQRLTELVSTGRIPVSERNIRFLAVDEGDAFRLLVERLSANADLVLFGYSVNGVLEKGADVFTRHSGLREVLFVCAQERIVIE
jgi:hypothetical protein